MENYFTTQMAGMPCYGVPTRVQRAESGESRRVGLLLSPALSSILRREERETKVFTTSAQHAKIIGCSALSVGCSRLSK
ncbi:MAG: hypothetical protein QOD03_1394 [Verrucomicrobiota bacterium]|jgi:hypothetical protein